MADPGDPAHVEAATAFAADALARGHEGVVVKSDEATYDMGRRGAGWVKVKPVHTLDLVLLAVERGNGRRSGWLSNLHLGALDPTGRYGEPGGFVMLGKTFKGLTDEMLRWQTQELPRHADGPTDGYVVRLRPEVVVEIAFDGVQTLAALPRRGGPAVRPGRALPDRQAPRGGRPDRGGAGPARAMTSIGMVSHGHASHPVGRCGTRGSMGARPTPGELTEGARHGRDL